MRCRKNVQAPIHKAKKRICLTLSQATLASIDEQAKALGLSRSQLIEQLAIPTQKREGMPSSWLENIPLPICVTSDTNQIVAINCAWESLFALPRCDVIGKPLVDVLPTELAKKACKVNQQVVQSRRPVIFEEWLHNADGLYCCRIVKFPLFDLAGEVEGIGGVFIDITENKEAMAALSRSEALFRQIVETANEGIWMIDADCRTTYLNQRMAEMLGCSIEEVFGRSYLDFTLPEDYQALQQRLERRKQGSVENTDFRLRRCDDSILWTNSSSSPIYGPNHEYIGALAMITDISERKKAEDTLKESQNKLAALIDSLPGMAFTGECFYPWNMSYASEGCFELTGYTSSELVEGSTSLTSLVLHEDMQKVCQAIDSAIEREEAYVIEYRIRTKDGQVRWLWEK